ncbi:hypothetical protein V1291_004495 [Nitrobacteraceae bacterium AZCC 1564]
MSREAAKIILETVLRHGAEQNNALIEIEPLCTEAEFSFYKQMIGRSMGEMLLDVINPILRDYPDLMPPGFDPPQRG